MKRVFDAVVQRIQFRDVDDRSSPLLATIVLQSESLGEKGQHFAILADGLHEWQRLQVTVTDELSFVRFEGFSKDGEPV